MKKSRLAAEIMSALIYCQALLVFAGVASVVMHADPEQGGDGGVKSTAISQPL